jgi:signal transduction histidine kinase
MDRNETDGPLRLVVPFGEDGRYACVFTLDVDGFHESYIVPAVAAALPHYEITWEAAAGRASGKTAWTWSEETFSFNPLRGLLAWGSPPQDELLISVPIFMTNFHGPYESDRVGSEQDAGGPPNPAALAPFNANDFRRSQDRLARWARVSIDGGSLARSIERRLSLNWLGAMTLLLGVALAFVQVLLQMNKLRIIRLREREFVASVTHELRTPLTVIQSAADNLVTGVVPADRLVRYGNLIIDQSKRLGNMIEEMLLFSRVEGRTMQSPVLVPVDIHAVIGDVRAAVEPLADQAGIGIVWDTGATNASCIGDAETIRLILSNLIANAVHHAYPGENKGMVRVIVKTALPGKLILQVEDDGRGIAPSESRRVFEPFYRDRVSRENHEKGSGLGLFLAAGKARIAGGTIGLESPYHRVDGTRRPGCRFTAQLPFAPCAPVVPVAEVESDKGTADA